MNMLVMLSAELAGINFSLVMNLYSLTPFLMAILFFSVFKEKLGNAHIIGMIFLFACVAITGESNSEAEKPADGKISALIPLILALIATVNFTITNFLSRYFIFKGCMKSSQQLMADSCIFQALAELTIFLILPNPYPF